MNYPLLYQFISELILFGWHITRQHLRLIAIYSRVALGMGIPMGMGWEWESYLSHGNSHRFSYGNSHMGILKFLMDSHVGILRVFPWEFHGFVIYFIWKDRTLTNKNIRNNNNLESVTNFSLADCVLRATHTEIH